MQLFPRHWFNHSSAAKNPHKRQLGVLSPRYLLWLLLLSCAGTVVATSLAQAQNEGDLKKQEDQLIQDFTLPKSPQAPIYRPRPVLPAPTKSATGGSQKAARFAPSGSRLPAAAPQNRTISRSPVNTVNNPTPPQQSRRSPVPVIINDTTPPSQYILEFNRSPIIGNRFRLRGIYSEARLGFTRPRGWKLQSVKALIRFQHSPALFASRSNLTVRVNGTSVGSVPLNRKQSQVGSALFNIRPNLIQDFNEVSMVAQQNNSNTCTDPSDQTLWTEILPDSKLIFNFQPQPVPLNFSRYPYPFFDDLALDSNHVAYLLPREISASWLTGAARFQAALGRIANFLPLNTRLLKGMNQAEANERLVIIGTPEEQPTLRQLKLPFAIADNQVLDGNQSPLPDDVGVLMVTTSLDSGVPVLVATGNGPEGVAKAVQSLVQSQDRKIATGQAILVSKFTDEPTPGVRLWPRYLPEKNSFQLSDLQGSDNKPFADVTVRGSAAPPIEFDFHALPDDHFIRGSSMNLRYSYGPQMNPRTSAVEVLLDGIFIGGERLTSESGETRRTLNVNLPENLIKPNSKIQIAFRMNPKEPPNKCGGQVTDQQLSGTVHADTSFHLNRETSVKLPDLKLLQVGFPFAAPQDLSDTAIVVPDSPSTTDVMTLLEFSQRLGRLSQADSVKLNVYTTETFPTQERGKLNLVGIGTREKFPFPEVFEPSGFFLKDLFSRSWDGGAIQTLPDDQGLIKEIISPWNHDRVLLALTAQTENGLDRVGQIFHKDPWFFQLQKDTVLISSNQQDASTYDPDAYKLEFLQGSQQRLIENTSLLSKVSRLLQEYWLLLPVGIVAISLLLYGTVQQHLKRLPIQDKK